MLAPTYVFKVFAFVKELLHPYQNCHGLIFGVDNC